MDEKLLLNKLQALVTNIKWSSAGAASLFDALLKRFQFRTTGNSHLLAWMLQMLHCIEMNYITPNWKCHSGKTLIDLVQDETLTDDNLMTCLADDREKTLDEIIEEIRQEKLNQIDDKLLEEVKDTVSSVVKNDPLPNDKSERSRLKKDLLMLCQAAEKTHFKPRLTQMVSWCIMALSKTGRLLQVGTGEGKSCIVAMFAAYRALRGEKVDIMSSSPVLAERDAEEWKTFYEYLKISVDCNTNKQDLKKCYECQVVYGTVEQFAGDWLRQHFHRKDIFGQRKLQCAIVDEVDSLMLDKGLHVVYLSSDMPALQHLNPLLALIWATINQYTKVGKGTTVGQKYSFHQVVLENLKSKDITEFTIFQIAQDTGLLPKGSVSELRKNLNLLSEKASNVTANQLAEFFKTVERRFPSCQFALHSINNNGEIEELDKRPQKETGEKERVPLLLLNGGLCQYMYSDKESVQRAAEAEIKLALHFTPCELSKDKSSCYVPGFLSDLVKSKLKVWIENAFYAKTMTMDHEYVIEKHGVVPVDYSCTGVVENFMQWSDGLHQFVEMKHGSKLSDMTAITNYMSSVGLLLRYGNQIFGISGTLGQNAETETLQKIYNDIETCRIPSFKRRKLFEIEGVVAMDEKEWTEKICAVVTTQTKSTVYRNQRAVLVICETINRAKALNKALGDKVPNKKLYVNNNMDNTEIFVKRLEAGDVIIATNLAGRGTDLKVSDSVNKAGGLFVVQTFLPKNTRVEAQAFGRTARQGSPGSAQLIICSSHLSGPLQLLVLTKKHSSLLENITDAKPLYQDLFVVQLMLYEQSYSDKLSKEMSSTLSLILTKNFTADIEMAKEVRDALMAEGLTSYMDCDIPKIKKKEELFIHYLAILDDVYKSCNNKPAASDLSAVNELWGMWLLKDFNEKDSLTELKNRLSGELKKARHKLVQRESPTSNLHHCTAFGNELREKGHLADSVQMYTKAIKQDRCWAAIAYYNRAFAALAQQDRRQDRKCIDEALQDLQNALKSAELYCEQINVTQRYITPQFKEHPSDAATRFGSHIIARYNVWLFFRANINEAINQVNKAKDQGGSVKVEESLVYFLIPLVNLVPVAMLSTGSVTSILQRDPLKIQQLISHPSFDILNEIRCLESLGLTHVYTLDTLFPLGSFLSRVLHWVSR